MPEAENQIQTSSETRPPLLWREKIMNEDSPNRKLKLNNPYPKPENSNTGVEKNKNKNPKIQPFSAKKNYKF